MIPASNHLGYRPQLDTLRAFAVGAVLVAHWFPHTHWLNMLPMGVMGVSVFFVLSGFLITRLLLQERLRFGDYISAGALYRQFLIRRALRIFPIYYLTLLVLMFIPAQFAQQPDLVALRENWGYFLTYTQNFYFTRIDSLGSITSHLWTLAIEEQFYLVWPLVVLFLPLRYVRSAIWLTIGVGAVSRLVLYWVSNETGRGVLTPGCIDLLGMGALLAYWQVCRPTLPYQASLKRLALIALPIFLVLVLVPTVPLVLQVLFTRTALGIVSLWVIDRLVRGITGPVGTVFNNAALRYIGKISYGIYLFHNLIPWVYDRINYLAGRYHVPIPRPVPGTWQLESQILIQLVLLLVLSAVSWQLLEYPINRLKSRFAGTVPQPKTDAVQELPLVLRKNERMEVNVEV